MQSLAVRFTRLSFVSFLLILAMSRPAAADPSGEYQGWLWESGMFFDSSSFSEENCFARNDLDFAVDLNWTLTLTNDVCWGRTTRNTGRTPDNFPPFTANNDDPDQSTRPLVNAGGNLWEVWGQEFEQGVGQGEERFATLMSLPSNDSLLMIGGYYVEADQFEEEYFRFIDLVVKNTTATQNARTEADLLNTNWRISFYAQALSTNFPGGNVEFSLASIFSVNLGANNVCTFTTSTVFPDFINNGDIYSANQFDFNVDFDDRYVGGGLAQRSQTCTWSIDADKYLVITRTATTIPQGDQLVITNRYVVSDDNQFLVSAPGTTLENSDGSLVVGYRTANQLASTAIDDTYFFYLNGVEFGADGAGAVAAGFGDRDWQENDLLLRGQVTFDSTTTGTTPPGESGTWQACASDFTFNLYEHEWTGSTNNSSVALGESGPETGNLVFDECSFRLAGDGGLELYVLLGDPQDPGLELLMAGYVNDSGEIGVALANGVDGDPGNTNKDSADLWHLLMMQYTGDPDADADGDGFTNFEEFRMPLPTFNTVDQDTNGDGRSDILFRNIVTGANQLYLMDGKSIGQNLAITSVNADWEIVGRGDYDGDEKSDILWRYTPTGAIWIFFMDGNTVLGSEFVTTISDSNWQIVGNGDYNGDGKSDILLRLTTTGTVWMFEMDGSTITNGTGVGVVPDLNWKIVGSGDYNGDGRSDILWRNVSNGGNWMYLMSGPNIVADAGVSTVPDLNWSVVGNGDYNGDGSDDILWRNPVNGTNWLYLMDGLTIDQSNGISVLADPNWAIVGDGDYNSDGRADVLWRNTSTGSNYMYLMDTFTIIDFGTVSVVSDQNWQIVNTP